MSDIKHIENTAHHEQSQHLTTVTLTSEQFEQLYLQPGRSAATGNPLVNRLGNPTALGISSFLVALLPLSMDLMGFQGASAASGTTLLGAFYGVAGIGLYLACIQEWVIGNTFPSLVFGVFGGFWIAYGVIVQPSFAIAASFSSAEDATNSFTAAAAGSATPEYNAGLGLYFLTWAILTTVLFLAALRTNVPFAGIFFFLILTFAMLSSAYFHIGQGRGSTAENELQAAGAFAFVTCLFGIWVDVALIFAAVGFPFQIPVIDLSGVKKGKSYENHEQA